MEKQYMYDIAISFAEEDFTIAEGIARSLKKKGLNVYYYKDERSKSWGVNLMDTIIKVFKYESRFALVLVSENYLKKKWTNLEREVIQSVNRESLAYLLPVKLDESELPWVSPNIIYQEYNNCPLEIASLCYEKIKNQPEISSKPFNGIAKIINYIDSSSGGSVNQTYNF